MPKDDLPSERTGTRVPGKHIEKPSKDFGTRDLMSYH
jgi:hypothetical protein